MHNKLKKIIVTGSAGFIGFSVSRYLLEKGHHVIGIDNHNDYYDPTIKESRLKILKNHNNYNHNEYYMKQSYFYLILFHYNLILVYHTFYTDFSKTINI